MTGNEELVVGVHPGRSLAMSRSRDKAQHQSGDDERTSDARKFHGE
jgi:hypothetical protein